MLQRLRLSPPCLDLPTVVLLSGAGKVLLELINLDVFRPYQTACTLGEANLTNKFLNPLKEPTAKAMVEFLAVEGVQRQFPLTTIRLTFANLTGLMKHRTLHNHAQVYFSRHTLPMQIRRGCLVHSIVATGLNRWANIITIKSWSPGIKSRWPARRSVNV